MSQNLTKYRSKLGLSRGPTLSSLFVIGSNSSWLVCFPAGLADFLPIAHEQNSVE